MSRPGDKKSPKKNKSPSKKDESSGKKNKEKPPKKDQKANLPDMLSPIVQKHTNEDELNDSDAAFDIFACEGSKNNS